MSSFAENTTVSPERSQAEIAGVVRKYGASSFATGWDGDRAMVSFIAHNRQVRFILELPSDWTRFRVTPGGRTRKEADAKTAMNAETRRRWRALALAIKAKLEVVETGISSFEDEFLAHTVLPSGRTVSQEVVPMVNQALAAGEMPRTFLELTA